MNAILFPTSVVCLGLGVSVRQIPKMIDRREVRWVFDLGLHGLDPRSSGIGRSSRHLRFYAPEIVAKSLGQPFDATIGPVQVVEQIVGRWKGCVHGVSLANSFLISRAHLLKLCRHGGLRCRIVGHKRWVLVNSLRRFLLSRLVVPRQFAEQAPPAARGLPRGRKDGCHE